MPTELKRLVVNSSTLTTRQRRGACARRTRGRQRGRVGGAEGTRRCCRRASTRTRRRGRRRAPRQRLAYLSPPDDWDREPQRAGHSVRERMGVRAWLQRHFRPDHSAARAGLVPTCTHSHLGPLPLGPVPTYMRGLLSVRPLGGACGHSPQRQQQRERPIEAASTRWVPSEHPVRRWTGAWGRWLDGPDGAIGQQKARSRERQ